MVARVQRGRDWLDLLCADRRAPLSQRASDPVRRRGRGRDQPRLGRLRRVGRAQPPRLARSVRRVALHERRRAATRVIASREYTTYNDSTQTNYYVLTGAVMAWPLAMEASFAACKSARISARTSAAGSEHCVTHERPLLQRGGRWRPLPRLVRGAGRRRSGR